MLSTPPAFILSQDQTLRCSLHPSCDKLSHSPLSSRSHGHFKKNNQALAQIKGRFSHPLRILRSRFTHDGQSLPFLFPHRIPKSAHSNQTLPCLALLWLSRSQIRGKPPSVQTHSQNSREHCSARIQTNFSGSPKISSLTGPHTSAALSVHSPIHTPISQQARKPETIRSRSVSS